MNKEIFETIMVRSRLSKKIYKGKLHSVKKHIINKKNYCVKLIRERTIKYFGDLNVKNITDNSLETDKKSLPKIFNDYFISPQ